MLADVCQSIATTVDLAVARYAEPRQVLEWFPRVLDSCDQLQFDDYAQALAYLILHMPDRYCRMFQVLERLLTLARLPIGRSKNFAAIDIGAGPDLESSPFAVSTPHLPTMPACTTRGTPWRRSATPTLSKAAGRCLWSCTISPRPC
jgi:hypothetical protein